MEEQIEIDDEMAQILDILEQVKRINSMIELHRREGDSLSLKQYEWHKQRLTERLQKVLAIFQINLPVNVAA